jgi:uncharacterized protein
MSLSIYEMTLPPLIAMLKRVDRMLDRGQQYADEKKFDSAVLASARLAPDMLPLNRQIHIATDNAKGVAARLANIEAPKFDDVEVTIADLRARIAKTIEFMKSVKPEQLDGSEAREIVLKFPSRTIEFPTGKDYVSKFLLPNFYFHVVMTYAILRHNGVTLGKPDFLEG